MNRNPESLSFAILAESKTNERSVALEIDALVCLETKCHMQQGHA